MTTLAIAQTTKKDRVIYWVFTGLFFLMDCVMPALTFNTPLAKQGIAHLGFPDYFRIELSVGKIIGGLLLILPFVPARYKEWAYVGFGISIISAFVSNAAVDGFTPMITAPILGFAILVMSYIYYHKIYSPYRSDINNS